MEERQAFDIWWSFVCPFNDWAIGRSGSAEEQVIRERLPANDWLLHLISIFCGSLENSGSFVDSVVSLADHAEDLRDAFLLFGYPQASAQMPACFEFQRDYEENAEDWTPEWEEKQSIIDDDANWTYAPLVEYLRAHDRDFSFSILPFCASA